MNVKNIVHKAGKWYVELIKINKEDVYHVFYTGITYSLCDSAYLNSDLAICRAEYLAKNKIELNN